MSASGALFDRQMSAANPLPSWRDGDARASILSFLDRADEIPVEDRVAVFDNDGTLWCERPNYAQLEFFVAELRGAAADQPDMVKRPEYAAVLEGDRAAIDELGIERIALALVELFVGLTPEEFAQRVRLFAMNSKHPELGVVYAQTTYQPMIELLALLREKLFSTFIVSGGGTEFVRAVSRQLYGIDPEGVVGTLVTYRLERHVDSPVLVRTGRVEGEVNEGSPKVVNIQMHLGRRPFFAAGNSSGDAEMLEYAAAEDHGLALVVNHDDPEREYAYASQAGTFTAAEPISETARRLGWTVVSMKTDWSQIFPSPN
jgi:phosphoserine phosphatase